jgi:heme a synthase
LLGALLGVFALVQAGLLFFKRNQNRRSYRLALGFLAVVILTGLFGAIVVKLNLAHLSISVHLFFALLLVQLQAALVLSLRQKMFSIAAAPQMRNLLLLMIGVLVLQGVLGTMVRMYVDDISRELQYGQREKWLATFPVSFILHRSFSWFVLLFTAFLVWKGRTLPALKNKLFILGVLVLLNMLAGIILFYADMPAAAQPIHLLLATMAITQTVATWLYTKKHSGSV